MPDAPAPTPAPPPSPPVLRDPWRLRITLAMLLLALAKLTLISHHEILVWGFDDAGFARSAEAGYWGQPYGQYTHTRQPVYPLFLAYARDLGLPARLAIELVWIAACFILVRGLRIAGAHPLIALTAGGLTMFHPWTICWFDRLAQDNLYAPLALVFFISIAAAVIEPKKGRAWRWGALAAVSGALAANTRPEAILLYGTLAVAALVSLALWRLRLTDGRTARRNVLAAFLIPLLAMQGLTYFLAHQNKQHIGVAVTTDFVLPGIKKLYSALLAIPPDPDAPSALAEGGHDPRLAISRDVRDKAYAVSPTFATLRPWLDGERRMKEFSRACRKQTGVSGEYGAWSVWAFRQAAWKSRRAQVGPKGWTSARELSDFYARAADEIRAAMADKGGGRLKSRAAPVPFMPPEWGVIIRRWPASLRATWTLIADVPYERMHSQQQAMGMKPVFDAVALRREIPARLADDPAAVISGSTWFAPARLGAFDRFDRNLANIYRPIMTASLGVAVIGAAVGWGGLLIPRLRARARAGAVLKPRWYILSLILGSALIARLLFISLLDVTGLPVLERYLQVVNPLLIALALIGLQATIAYLAAVFTRRPPSPATAP